MVAFLCTYFISEIFIHIFLFPPLSLCGTVSQNLLAFYMAVELHLGMVSMYLMPLGVQVFQKMTDKLE